MDKVTLPDSGSPGPPVWIPAIFCILSIPALVVSSGSYPITIYTDEPIRALVTKEMLISGNWLAPTLNGEYYFNKPPLYNWLIIASWKIFGVDSVFGFRFPMILSWFVLGLLTWHFTFKHTGKKALAFATSIFSVTHGRLLYYDTLLGLIDLTYACITYAGFMVIYTYGQAGNWKRLFLASWTLTAIGTLTKGITSPLFQVLTLSAYFLLLKPARWRLLFNRWHWAGILLYLLILSAYFVPYFAFNQVNPNEYFEAMFQNSTKATPLQQKIGKVFLHLFTYPLQMFYDFAPWTWFVLLLFRKETVRLIRSHPFIEFNVVVFLINFIIYWISPDTFARYLFMLLPLLFCSLAYFYLEQNDPIKWQRLSLDWLMRGLLMLSALGAGLLPLFNIAKQTSAYWGKSLTLCLALLFLALLSFRKRHYTVWLFTLGLVVVRIGFNWFVLDRRGNDDRKSVLNGANIARIAEGKPVFIYGMKTDPQYSVIGSQNGISYNYSKASGQILRFSSQPSAGGFYLALKKTLDTVQHQKSFTFFNPNLEGDSLVMFKFNAFSPAAN